jgi:hypothetical protein
MDPLSVTASIVTLLTVAGKAHKELEQLRLRMDPSAELLMFMNSVSYCFSVLAQN